MGDSLFDADDDEGGTLVDNTFWQQPKIPPYPALARFGRYEILGRIARGGMAEVYLARDRQGDGSVRHVVVKRVLPEMEDNPQLLAMFLEEGKTATRLYHTNVCHAYEVGEIDGHVFMALEWVFGPSLQDMIARANDRQMQLPWAIACEIVCNVASGLAYVHQAKAIDGQPLNIVHRDVSPHNVMITWGGQVKLLDFGIAKTSAGDDKGATVGKYGYLSPEQAQNKPVDARSDLFALGIVLYELLTGRPLYDRPNIHESLSAIVREPVPSIREARPDVPETIDRILQKALAKRPDDRFSTAEEMKNAIKQVMRANGQTVNENRIAVALAGMFTLLDKEPLRPDQRQVTGAFAPLSAESAAALLEAQAPSETYTFDHERPSAVTPPPPEPAPVAAAPPKKKKKSRWVLWTLLFLIAGLAGGAAALWYMKGRPSFPEVQRMITEEVERRAR